MKAVNLKSISGGQTGADRDGLDWAIAAGIPHGGWCPKGRKATSSIPSRKPRSKHLIQRWQRI